VCRLRVRNQAKRLHRTSEHPRKQAPPLQSGSLEVQALLPEERGSGPVRQSGNSIRILVVTTGVEVRAGFRKGKVRESKCKIKSYTNTGLGANLSFAT